MNLKSKKLYKKNKLQSEVEIHKSLSPETRVCELVNHLVDEVLVTAHQSNRINRQTPLCFCNVAFL